MDSHIRYTLGKLYKAEDMTFEEAENSMDEIMSGTVPPVLLAAWLTALNMKGENSSEIAGCAASMRKHSRKIKCDDPDAVDIVGTGGDKSLSINISTAAAFVAAGAGVTVAKHGNKAVSGKVGSADVFEALGIKINLSPEKIEECLKRTGIAFLYAPSLHPSMKHAMPVRKELGLRSIFNILGPLANPALVRHHVIGVYSRELSVKVAEAARQLGFGHSMIVHGHDGLDEITVTDKTYIHELAGGSLKEYDLSPAEFNIPLADKKELQGNSPKENAAVIMGIFDGSISGAKLDIIALNAAAAIFVSGKAVSMQEAFAKAKESISSGMALIKLTEMADFTKSL